MDQGIIRSREMLTAWLEKNFVALKSELKGLSAYKYGQPFEATFYKIWHELFGAAKTVSRMKKKEQQPHSNTADVGIIIRHARLDDFPDIFTLLKQLWPNRVLNREKLFGIFQNGLNSPRIEYLCLQVDDRTLGFCSLQYRESFWQQEPFLHVNEMVIEKNARGKGWGTVLLNYVIEICKRQGCVSVILDSDFHRLRTHNFYTKFGFIKTGYLFEKKIV